MAKQISALEKFKGALLGCAVGDALGAPVEGLPPEAIKQKYGRVTEFLNERFGAGMVTDDTQMTVVLAQAILEVGHFDTIHTAFKFGRWMETSDNGIKEARGVGMACAAACRSLYKGVRPAESGLPSAGCGAAMRAAPIGLRYYHDLDGLKKAAVEQALITHTDPEALAGSAAVAFAVARGITDEGDFDRLALLEDISGFVSSIDEGMARKIEGIASCLDSNIEDGFNYTGTSGYVMETVPGSLFAFLRTPFDFEETVVTAVNAGGDTDSLGAIAGATSGALNGTGSIPSRFLDNVEGKEYLELLAERLITLTPAGKPESRPTF